MSHHQETAPASLEAMKSARLDIAYRDGCAHMLIPLNACRRDTLYLPWKCGHERHAYEECQYYEHLLRVKSKLDAE